VSRKAGLDKGDIALLRDEAGEPLLSDPEDGKVVWAGNELDVRARALEPGEIEEHERMADEWYECPEDPVEHPPGSVSASDLEVGGSVGDAITLGERISLNGRPDMQLVGNAVHGFLAADRSTLDDRARWELAEAILTRRVGSDALSPEPLMKGSDNLRAWIDANWPAATWHREWPVMMRLQQGTVLRGISDLVLETNDGFVVIDHKSFPGNREKAIEAVSGFAGQINAYADAIAKATGKPVLDRFIHMPIMGLLFPVGMAC
jgi:ATP-dependent exoDNAse (exonuclease V) beta subunit